MRLTETEREELIGMSQSEILRSDCERVADGRHNPFLLDGEINADRVVDFLTEYNEFFNHPIKPFTPPVEDNMKL